MQRLIDATFPAYLDPGTGSYALQLLLAGLFGGMFALKQSWAGLKARASARLGPRTGPAPRPLQATISRDHAHPTAENE